jgi:hypothetical protein
LRSEICQTAGTIADHGGKTREAAIRDQAVLDDVAEHVWIDVTAAKQKHDPLTDQLGELIGKTGRESGGSGTFHDALFQLDNAEDGERDLFLVYEDNFVGVPAGNLESVAADLRDRETIGERRVGLDPDRFSLAHRGEKTGDVIRLDRDDFCLRVQRFHRERNTGEETAAADRDDDRVKIRHLRDTFEAGRALAGDDSGIIVAIDLGKSFLLRGLMGANSSFGKSVLVQDDSRA